MICVFIYLSNLVPRDVSRFEQKNVSFSFPKEVQIDCPDPQRLPFKGSLSLQNLPGSTPSNPFGSHRVFFSGRGGAVLKGYVR